MRLFSALRGRQRGYSSLSPLCEPCNQADPPGAVEVIPVAEADRGPFSGMSVVSHLGSRTLAENRPMAGMDGSPRGDREVDRQKPVEDLSAKQIYLSEPQPPPNLWDTDDVQYLDKVKCHCWVRLTHIDPKNGSYEGRMKCHWALRTLNTKDRTEPRIRVPGIRLPRLVCHVEESRIWRHFDGDSEKTIAWQGTSVISFTGFEIFEVHDFPFDRQIITLDLFEFVWRDDKDTDVYHEAMKIVSFTMETLSMLPEWDTYPAVIDPCDILHPGSGPTFGTRFIVKLRLQRKERYYVTHIFLVSLLILVASLLPLAFEPGDAHVGDRLSIHSGGLLTLVAFKYGVSADLPSVPYATFISTFLTAQILTLVAVSGETIFAYKMVDVYIEKTVLDYAEDALLVGLLITWTMYFLHLALSKKRKSWEEVLGDQDNDDQLEGHDHEPPTT
jgi:hypothetical protein